MTKCLYLWRSYTQRLNKLSYTFDRPQSNTIAGAVGVAVREVRHTVTRCAVLALKIRDFDYKLRNLKQTALFAAITAPENVGNLSTIRFMASLVADLGDIPRRMDST